MSSFFDKGIKSYRNASNLGEKKLARNIWCKRKKGVTTRLTRTGSVNSDATSLHADPKWPSAVRRSGSSGEGAIDARYRAISAPLQLPWRPSPDPLLQWESETPETHRQSRRGTEQRSQALSLSPRVFVSLKWEREREREFVAWRLFPSFGREIRRNSSCVSRIFPVFPRLCLHHEAKGRVPRPRGEVILVAAILRRSNNELI